MNSTVNYIRQTLSLRKPLAEQPDLYTLYRIAELLKLDIRNLIISTAN